ncbi:heat shock protein 30C-like [Rhinatrema bivittatum]|uniref:heat shock protein 30C-like n=1 Tax=Rhinatrema bivittatum TaxID=194408 RepID=UPI0011264E3A|nr:heat shock protein 30C-like [Rhinatrema bivittatum]
MLPIILHTTLNPLCACREPVRTLWPVPDTLSICQRLEDELLRHLRAVERRQHLPHQLLSKDLESRGKPAESSLSLDNEAKELRSKSPRAEKDTFQLSLDVKQFSPEELMVKTEGGKLIVMGKHEKKTQAGDGSSLHEYRELRREAELPEDVNPEAVLCFLTREGQLHIEAPRLALPAAKERPIPICISQSPEERPGHLSSEEKEPENSKEQRTENQKQEAENGTNTA